MTTYHALDETTVVDYLRGQSATKNLFDNDAPLQAAEVGDGNLNLVFIVKNQQQPEQAVIVKQALPFLRVAGDSWPLTRERMRFEAQALMLYNELTPGLAPQVYLYDDEMRSEEHTSELQSRENLVCRLLLDTKIHSDRR